MLRLSACLLLVCLVLPGCISEQDFVAPETTSIAAGPPSELDPRLPAAANSPRVVVALVDSGTNPYHDWFRRGDSLSDDVLSALADADGNPPLRVNLSHDGNFSQRVDADKALLKGLKAGQLYYFEGTNLLGISFNEAPENGYLFLSGASHGTATSGAVSVNNPNAIVVMVQDGSYAKGEEWAAARPWIDVVSMSYGPPGSVPGSAAAFGLETHANTKAMWKAGKVPVGAADNSPAFAPNDETAGPPWVVGVAGDNSTLSCREHESGSVPDYTSDFTQVLPAYNDTHNLSRVSGTSFATPKTASTISRAIYEVRVAWGHQGGITDGALALSPDGKRLTFDTLRASFNRTARYFPMEACQPKPGSLLPVNPVAPYAQMGWGHMGPEIVNATVADLLGEKAAPEKPAEARAYQESMYRYRESVWSRM